MGIADKLAQSVVPALLKALYHQCHVLRLRSLAGSSSDINTCEATIVRGALDRVEGHDQIQSLIGTGVLVKEDQKIALSTVWT
jgi:hypothetical protein